MQHTSERCETYEERDYMGNLDTDGKENITTCLKQGISAPCEQGNK